MTFASKYTDKYEIDMSRDNKKYRSRTDGLMNILYCCGELPNDLYHSMNISYDCYRKNISRVLKRGLIQRVSDGVAGYQLTLKGKRITTYEINYLKYRYYVEEEIDRHYSIKRRMRKRQQAYLSALLDRAGITYEVFRKPKFEDAIYGDTVYYFEANDFKRMIPYESTPFRGSRILGFFVGKQRIIPIYKMNSVLSSLGKHEILVPEAIKQHFNVAADTAILISGYVEGALNQVVNGYNLYDEKINIPDYPNFYVFSSGDHFLSHFQDLYVDYSSKEREIIERYHIDTSEYDRRGRSRYIIGTGFIDESPVWVCAGNVNAVTLRYFILNAEHTGKLSLIFCQQRDYPVLTEVTKGRNIKVLTIKI